MDCRLCCTVMPLGYRIGYRINLVGQLSYELWCVCKVHNCHSITEIGLAYAVGIQSSTSLWPSDVQPFNRCPQAMERTGASNLCDPA